MITLVLGGVRSGKSEAAENMAAAAAAATGDPVTYVATGDGRSLERVAVHRARRPDWWETVQEPRSIAKVLAETDGIVLIDSLGSWLAHDVEGADVDDLVGALAARVGDTIVVSEEVGLGVHPVSALGRRFADRLGETNRAVAAAADRVVLVAAGRLLDLPANIEPLSSPTTTRPGGLRSALGFLTILGGDTGLAPHALEWFAPVGLVTGLALGAAWRGLTAIGPALLAAALVVFADAIVTGGLHLDGLSDSADGLLPPLPRARRLAILRDPHTGAFGVAALVVVLLVRVAALSAFNTGRPVLLGAVWCASRGAAAVMVRTLPYARRNGLASDLRGGRLAALPVIAGALALVASAFDVRHALPAVAVAVAVGAATQWLAVRRLGGFTGDTVGAGIVLGETAGLVLAALL